MEGDITLTDPDNAKTNKAVAFENNAPFINSISKINGLKIDNAEDLDVVCLNTVKITEKQQAACGIITEMSQLILFLLILNLLNTRQVIQEILAMLVMMLVKIKLKSLFH